MSATRPGQLLRRLAPPDPDDGPLLARFAADRDPAAFAALVRRHGPVVLAVCRRVTGHPQDAEDAFQAVFLVLAKKAHALRDPGRLGNWLYGVSVKVASRARRAAARRRVREVQAVDPPDPVAPDFAPPADIGPALHEELAALPAHYREPIVLCDLQGATRADAAKALGVPEGTLSSRLANGRRKLAERLTRRGVVLSALGVPAAVAEGRAAVSESLVHNTCGVVAAWAAGAVVPAAVVRLAAGGFPVKTVLLGGALALSLVAGAVIAGGRADPAPEANPPAPPPPAAVAVPEEPQEGGAPLPKEPPAPKEVTLSATPKLRDAIDLPLRGAQRVVWSPTGDRMIVVTPVDGRGMPGGEGGGPGVFTNEMLYVVSVPDRNGPRPVGHVSIPSPHRFHGLTPDGKHLVTAQREAGLVSGKHRVSLMTLGAVEPVGGGEGGEGGLPGGGSPGGAPPLYAAGPAGAVIPIKLRAGFDIDPEQSDDFAFAPDGKSYRTLVLTRDDAGIRKATVQRVSTETGKVLDTLGTIDGPFATARLSPDGTQVLTINPRTLAVESYTAEGRGRWQLVPKLDLVAPTDAHHPYPLGVSRDGGRVLAGRGFGRLHLIDGKAGDHGPALEGTELVDSNVGAAAFTADGRLMAVPYHKVEKNEAPRKGGQMSVTRGEARLGVWDTTTGKLVRSWPGRVTAVAFHPTRPVLAVLEPNGAQTRLGLWDFSAE